MGLLVFWVQWTMGLEFILMVWSGLQACLRKFHPASPTLVSSVLLPLLQRLARLFCQFIFIRLKILLELRHYRFDLPKIHHFITFCGFMLSNLTNWFGIYCVCDGFLNHYYHLIRKVAPGVLDPCWLPQPAWSARSHSNYRVSLCLYHSIWSGLVRVHHLHRPGQRPDRHSRHHRSPMMFLLENRIFLLSLCRNLPLSRRSQIVIILLIRHLFYHLIYPFHHFIMYFHFNLILGIFLSHQVIFNFDSNHLLLLLHDLMLYSLPW